ncbi:MAG TPA: AAA family ATPase [Candidatus Kapabacteria bacterium]|nr:AAA family ATPase [Candidatus Kapabacteria bacterium]
MKRYIFTGTPGSGKTSLLRELKHLGYCIIEEAATDVIAFEQEYGNLEPWLQADFIDKIVEFQKQRQLKNTTNEVQLYDRSPICTLALSRYLGHKPSDTLLEELERIERDNIFEQQVLFLDNLGFVEPTGARKISFENALIFEKIHKEAYIDMGYELIIVPPEPLAERARRVMDWLLTRSAQ